MIREVANGGKGIEVLQGENTKGCSRVEEVGCFAVKAAAGEQ